MDTSSIGETSAEPGVLNASDIHTQGNNFLSAVQTGVDPRTGQFNLAISIPLGQANALGGPIWSFVLTFNALRSQVNEGFGLGWSLQYSHLHREGEFWTLALSTGEQFAVDLDSSDMTPGGRWAFHDLKLESMQVSLSTDSQSIQILYKTGDIEILKRPDNTGPHYVLHEMRSPEGHRLYFDWTVNNEIYLLTDVRDENRTLMTYNLSSDELILEPNSTEETTIQFIQNNDQLSFLLLPEISEPFGFRYDSIQVGNQSMLLPGDIKNPLGATDSVNWSRNLESSHRLPKGAPLTFIPRVLTWLHSDGPDSVSLLHKYDWGDDRNYLGGSSSQEFDWVRGRDTLYLLTSRYEYSCTETQISGDTEVLQWLQATLALREKHPQLVGDALLSTLSQTGILATETSITRTWDRHHLLLREVTLTGKCQTTRETIYGVDYEKHWIDQIPQCQLPHLVSVTYDDLLTGRTLSEETEYEYDHFGNVRRFRMPSQVEEVSDYYPSAGETPGCPPDPFGRIRFLKCKIITPDPDCAGSAPVLCTRYQYESLPSLVAGDPDHVVVCLEELHDVTADQQLEKTTQSHERNPGEHYGRPKKTVTTMNGKSTTTTLDYDITREPNELPLLWTTTKIEGFESNALTTTTSKESRSLLSGLTHSQVNASGVVTVFSYDRLGRVISAIIAEGSAYRVERTCQVHIADEFVAQHAPRLDDNPSATIAIEETDATGQRKRSWLDGSGRPVLVQLEDIDSAPGTFRDVRTARYDAWGREIKQVDIDWTREGKRLFELTTTTAYDDWGNACLQTDPTGVVTHTTTDPTRRLVETWQEGTSGKLTGKQATTANAAGSPLKIEVFDAKGNVVRTQHYTRDGLDRVTRLRTTPQQGVEQIHDFEYDSYSRLTARLEHFRQGQDEDEQVIRVTRWQYAAHSDGNHQESVTVELAGATIGSQRAAS